MGEIARRNPHELSSAAVNDNVQSEGPNIMIKSGLSEKYDSGYATNPCINSRLYSPAVARSRSKNDMRQPGGQLREKDDDQQADELE
jgi:hypothetical protein